MPTFYYNRYQPGADTERPVLKGQTTAEWINPYTGKLAVYSNWSIFSKSHLLDGAPDINHVPGTGYFPHGLMLSQMFTGKFTRNKKSPLYNGDLGLGAFGLNIRQPDGRFGPFRFHGITTIWASTRGKYGHTAFPTDDYAWNLNNFYRGATAPVLQTTKLGHAIRPLQVNDSLNGPGQASSFGSFYPTQFYGLPEARALGTATLGQAEPTNPDILKSPYGHNQVLLWQGIPSAKAL